MKMPAKILFLMALGAGIIAPRSLPAAFGQTLKVDPAAAAAPQPLEDRRKALARLFSEVWEDNLRHAPEFASSLGDKRYNDQITDYSVKAVNDWLAQEQNFLLQVAAIDPTGRFEVQLPGR